VIRHPHRPVPTARPRATGPGLAALALALLVAACAGDVAERAEAPPAGAGAPRDAPAGLPTPPAEEPGAETGGEPAREPADGPAGAAEATEAMPAAGAAAPPVDGVQIFLVDLEAGADDGTFGCGDRLVGVGVTTAAEGTVEERVAAAVRALLEPGGEQAPGHLYDALERSALTLDRVEPAPAPAGLYRVHLAGTLALGGVCDHPRVRAQLEATATQFAGVEEVEFYVGGEPLDALLAGRGQ